MMEKQNRMQEKQARGDSGVLDDLVEGAARRFAQPHAPKRRLNRGVETLPCAEEPACPPYHMR